MFEKMAPGSFVIAAAACLLLTATGCHSIGPVVAKRDRSDYVAALSDAWKHQMLLNIVKTRYLDAPVFLDVTSLITAYTLESEVVFHAGWKAPPYATDQYINFNGTFSDRPTITYSPLTGEKFARSFMRPIPPSAIIQMIESGYRADLVLRLCVQSINGLRNRSINTSQACEADPEFYRLAEKFAAIQRTGHVSTRLQEQEGKAAALLVLEHLRDPAAQDDVSEVIDLLRLAPEATQFQVVYGSAASSNTEIAMQTRSMLQIMMALASQIEVPEKDVAEQRVPATYRGEAVHPDYSQPLLEIRCSPSRPADAFVSVSYRGQWFWIDDRDTSSKSLFSFLMFMFSLTETGGKAGAPIMTISTN